MSEVVRKIVSGGQSGVDRGALDAALAFGLDCGGWCPQGRRAEDGVIADRYPLQETPSRDYSQRTEWNVRDSDATLILNEGELLDGTALTLELAQHLSKPCLVMQLEAPDHSLVKEWLLKYRVSVVNVAGPRESKCPGVRQRTESFLMQLLSGTDRSSEAAT